MIERRITVFKLCLLVAGTGSSVAMQSVHAHDGERGYIAMGDSIDYGIGASSPDKTYVALLAKHLESEVFRATADLHNLAVPGATARDIKQAQLGQAQSEIVAHHPRVVSWGGGGNDLLNFISSPEAATCSRGNRSCLARLDALLNELEQTIDRTLGEIRAVAGDFPVYVRTQYNALLKRPCGGPDSPLARLANAVLEGSPSPRLVKGLNTRLRELAQRYQAKVIDTFLPFYLNPDEYIADDCTHPTDKGHFAIFTAAQFAY